LSGHVRVFTAGLRHGGPRRGGLDVVLFFLGVPVLTILAASARLGTSWHPAVPRSTSLARRRPGPAVVPFLLPDAVRNGRFPFRSTPGKRAERSSCLGAGRRTGGRGGCALRHRHRPLPDGIAFHLC